MACILLISASESPLGRLIRACDHGNGWRMVQITSPGALASALEGRQPALLLVEDAFPLEEIEAAFARARARDPAMGRLLLAERPGTAPFLRGAQQVVPARTSPDVLRSTLEAALAVAERLQRHAGLARLISGFEKVPSPPTLYLDLRAAMDSRSGDVAAMARIAAQDPALVAEVLKLANSGFFARPRAIADPVEAVGLLGADMLLGLVLATHVFAGIPVPGIRLEALWQHALDAAALAGHIAAAEGRSRAEQSVSAVGGMLHDLGMLVLLENDPAGYPRLWRESGGAEARLCELELERYGATHAELGGTLLALWSMPEAISTAVARSHHWHEPLREASGEPVLVAEWLLGGGMPEHPGGAEAPVFTSHVPPQRRRAWAGARDRLSVPAC